MTGLWYRVRMRLAHRCGYCKPAHVGGDEGMVWCHWCGMRGRVVTKAQMERAAAEMSAQSDGSQRAD